MPNEVYLPSEIAIAADVPLEQVVAAVGGLEVYVPHHAAVLLGRKLRQLKASNGVARLPLFATVYAAADGGRALRIPLTVAGALQAAMLAALVVGSFGTVGGVGMSAAVVQPAASEPPRLVFIASPGPGGGGGGGGRRQPVAASLARKRGTRETGNPVSPRPPVNVEDPQPQPLDSESFPVLVAPIAPVAANTIDRAGTIDSPQVDRESHGAGQGGGAGTGQGSGAGSGTGAGIGPGVGGGTGGGVYRPGSGVQPPRLVREIKPEYPDAERRRGVEGEVVMELVVRRDGTPSDIRVIRRLGPEFDARAVDAVRQWRFEPGRLKGTPVDVAVEISVDFRLR